MTEPRTERAPSDGGATPADPAASFDQRPGAPEELRVGSHRMPLPRNRIVRMTIGGLLILFGVAGFLPILGFWMIPVGIAVLAVDVPAADRLRRRAVGWWRDRGGHPPSR